MVKKIISGGQIGADIAGLRAAKALGLETGGTAPRHFRTLGGEMPELGEIYGLVESEEWTYPPRTRANVRESDGTVRFAFNFRSPGELCTLKAINDYKKPYFDVPIVPGPRRIEMAPKSLEYWLRSNAEIEVLNVAGNGKAWLEPIVEDFLVTALSHVRET